MATTMKMIRGSFRPPNEIAAERSTEWVHVRLIEKPGERRFIGFDATEGFDVGVGVVVPGVCVATTRAELAEVIKALNELADGLAE